MLQQVRDFRDVDEKVDGIIAEILSLQHALRSEVTQDGARTRDTFVKLHETTINKERFQELMKSLSFPAIDSREDDIHETFEDTFHWIFSPDDETVRPWSNFVTWLEQKGESSFQDHIYWINGKAGSGKSTLMKFISDHDNLRDSLKKWSDDKPPLTLKFYFWRAGTQEQKSILGLLRSLTLQMLDQCPSLASSIVPLDSFQIKEWTVKRLSQSFFALLKQRSLDLKSFIMIDGLDEFDGARDEQEKLLDMIKQISTLENVKLCISSRPDRHLILAFGFCHKLKLQDLTGNDLQAYATGRLRGSPLMQKHLRDRRRDVEFLIEEVRHKADGVFLWLYLAIQDLLSGLETEDSLEMLHQRLMLLNNTLDGLFRQLLEKIHPVHRSHTARYVAFLQATQKHPCIKIWGRYQCEKMPTSLLDAVFGIEKNLSSSLLAILASQTHITNNSNIYECIDGLESLQSMLLTRSAGLLDVGASGCSKSPKNGCDCLKDYSEKNGLRVSLLSQVCHHYEGKTLSILHRSVLDFLDYDAAAKDFMKGSHFSDVEIALAHIEASRGAATIHLQLMNDACRALEEHQQRNQHTAVAKKTSRAHKDKSSSLKSDSPESYKYHQVQWLQDMSFDLAAVMRIFEYEKTMGRMSTNLSRLLKDTELWLKDAAPQIRAIVDPWLFNLDYPPEGFRFSFFHCGVGPEHMFLCNAVKFGLWNIVNVRETLKANFGPCQEALLAWCLYEVSCKFIREMSYDCLDGFEADEFENFIFDLLVQGANPNFQLQIDSQRKESVWRMFLIKLLDSMAQKKSFKRRITSITHHFVRHDAETHLRFNRKAICDCDDKSLRFDITFSALFFLKELMPPDPELTTVTTVMEQQGAESSCEIGACVTLDRLSYPLPQKTQAYILNTWIACAQRNFLQRYGDVTMLKERHSPYKKGIDGHRILVEMGLATNTSQKETSFLKAKS